MTLVEALKRLEELITEEAESRPRHLANHSSSAIQVMINAVARLRSEAEDDDASSCC